MKEVAEQVQIPVNPVQLHMPTHDTDGKPLPDWVVNKLPVGTVSVQSQFNVRYQAKNAVGKEIMIPRFGDVNYVPTFDNIQPMYDKFGHRLSPEIERIIPFGSYNILVDTHFMIPYVSYYDIDGHLRFIDL
jgi:hypothetical protein